MTGFIFDPTGIDNVYASIAAILLFKLTALLTVAWLFHAALSRCNPRWRVLLWRATAVGAFVIAGLAICPPIVKVAVLPAVPASNPTLRLELIPVSDNGSRHAVPQADSRQVSAGPAKEAEIPRLEFAQPVSVTLAASDPAEVVPTDRSLIPMDSSVDLSGSVTSQQSRAANRNDNTGHTTDFLACLWAIWAGGVLVRAASTLVGLHRLCKIRNRTASVPDWIESTGRSVGNGLGLMRIVGVRQSAEVQSPCLIGLIDPMILLPERQCDVNYRSELPSILAHELAHYRGGDLPWNLVLSSLSTVLWFHPFMWRVRAIHLDACDAVSDAVAASYIGDATIYGRTLARLTLRITGDEIAVGLAMAKKSGVQRRIEAIRQHVYSRSLPFRRAAFAVIAATTVVVLLGGISLTRSNAEPPKSTDSGTEAKTPAATDSGAERRGSDPDQKTQPRENAGEGAKKADGRMSIRAVSNATGESIEGVKIRFNGRINNARVNTTIETNADGMTGFEWQPGGKVDNLWFVASAPGYVPINYNWRSDRREIQLQEHIELRFDPGNEIGGIVQDETGRPIAGAKIDLHLPNTWPRLENWVFTAGEFTTDDEGRWRWDGAPDDLDHLGIGVSHPNYIAAGSSSKKGFDNVTILKLGLTVSGRVVDQQGQPIQGAKAQLGVDRWGTGEPNAATGADGRYVIKKCKPGPSLVTVQADGFSPQFCKLTVGDKNEGFDFKLEPGHTLRVRIVDAAGKPLPGAMLAADTWRSYRALEFRGTGDGTGEITWPSAPADAVLCDILKEGHMSVRKLALQASDEIQIVTLPPPLVISGQVTDAASGKPIDKFEVREGYYFSANDQLYWSRDAGQTFTNGRFSVKYTEPMHGRVIQVLARGYLPVNTRTFGSNEGSQTFDLALKPGSGVSGVVLLADGTPAAGADVTLATREKRASLEMGRFGRNNRAELVKADEDGRFSFLPQKNDAYSLIAAHEQGFASVSRAEFEKSNHITLRPWGRVEGRVFESTIPDANREVALYPRWTESRSEQNADVRYRTTTDDEGRFVFDRVVPGLNTLTRVLVTEHSRGSTHSYGWQTPVEVREGATSEVKIGGTGWYVTGRIVLDGTPELPVDWSIAPVSIGPSNKSKGRQTEESARYIGRILKSGRFRVADVPAGDYTLSVSIQSSVGARWPGEGIAIGSARLDFTVPEPPSGHRDAPFDLGDIKSVLLETLAIGNEAPDFVAEKLAGGTLRLSALRGKLILLAFVAMNRPETATEPQNLDGLYAKFSKDPRFTIISIHCDPNAASTKEALGAGRANWLDAHLGQSGLASRAAKQYFVRTLPASFLISPDGHVLAKNAGVGELEKTVAAALTDDSLFAAALKGQIPPRYPVVRFEKSAESPKWKSAPAAIVLDDTDPSFEQDQPRDDRLRLLSATGEELSSLTGFNCCQTVGAAHGVAIDRKRGRFYVRENVGHRITAFTIERQKLWQIDHIDADSLAVDEQTGHLWCSGGQLLNEGETVVFDAEGNEVAAYPYRGVDLAFDLHHGAVWLVGYETVKLNRAGEVLFRKKTEGWCCASVSVNPTAGSVWIAERSHPDVANSRNRLWLLNSDGSVRRQIELGDQNVFVVKCDHKSGDAWISGYKMGLRRVPLGDDPGEPLPIEASNISISPTTGDLWVTTEDAVLKLDASGKVVARSPFRVPSRQAWLEAF